MIKAADAEVYDAGEIAGNEISGAFAADVIVLGGAAIVRFRRQKQARDAQTKRVAERIQQERERDAGNARAARLT